MTDLSLLTAVLLVIAAVLSVFYLVVMFMGWADRRDSEGRNR